MTLRYGHFVTTPFLPVRYGQFVMDTSSLWTKKHPKLGAFMYDDRLLQNHLVEHIKLIEAGERDAPEKNDSGDRKILQQRRKLTQNIQQMLHPSERADEIIKRLYHLGKDCSSRIKIYVKLLFYFFCVKHLFYFCFV
uniref:CARD domain-containing protein n=1 Tax=Panagrolaimus davidi TaxID=227884 RepID=A0A914QAQ6_9BILA